MADLDGRMHITLGNADDARGDAGAADLDGVGVVSCGAGEGPDLDGDAAGVGGLGQVIEEARVGVGAADDDGALA